MRPSTVLFMLIVPVSALSVPRLRPDTFIYVSPLPGSSFVSRQTNIILRGGALIDRVAANDPHLLDVSGSRSGLHSGTMILADDSKTLVFNTSLPFGSGEIVTVTMTHGIRTVEGAIIQPISFSFIITATDPRIPDQFTSAQGPADFREAPTLSILDSIPADFPRITLLTSDNPSPGGIFLSDVVIDTTIHTTYYLMILNNQGYPVSYRRLTEQAHGFTLQPNGMLSYFLVNSRMFVVTDTSYDVAGTYTCGNGYVTDPHELRLLPNGHALMIGLDYQTVRMDTIVPGGNPNAVVIGNTVQELDQSRNVVFQWRSWDHFRIVDAIHEDLTAPTIDYVHMNAIDVDADSNLLISSRNQEEITKINRTTGDIIWRWGGRHNQFTFINDTLGFSRQHAIRRIPNGHVTLFDNGIYHIPPFSRALEYQLDEIGRTATLVWQYRHTPDILSLVMGYAQRLDNGNTIIGWGSANPTITEVREDGSKALELTLPPGVCSYRAYRFPWPLTQTEVPFQHPAGSYVLEQNFPNPFNPSTVIRYAIPREEFVSVRVFSTLGQQVAELVSQHQQAGNHEVVFHGDGLASGVYFCRLQTGDFMSVKKLLLVK